MKCDHCDSTMSLSSMVCTSSCCSFSYECGICGRQRLTSEPIPAGQRTAAQWPDKSGYNPGKSLAPDHQARHILDHDPAGNNLRSPGVLSLDATADMADAEHFVVDPATIDSTVGSTVGSTAGGTAGSTADSNSLETVEDLARDFSYN